MQDTENVRRSNRGYGKSQKKGDKLTIRFGDTPGGKRRALRREETGEVRYYVWIAWFKPCVYHNAPFPGGVPDRAYASQVEKYKPSALAYLTGSWFSGTITSVTAI